MVGEGKGARARGAEKAGLEKTDDREVEVDEASARAESSSRKAYHHGNLRRMLIAAGRDLVARDGPAALSLRETARIAGVSHNAPYRHFASREALLAAIAAAGFVDLREALLKAAAAAPEQRLQELGKAYLRFALEHRADFMLMFGSIVSKSNYPELKEAALSALDALRQNVAEGASEDLEEKTIRAWALAHGLAHLVADGQLLLETALAVLDGAKPVQRSG